MKTSLTLLKFLSLCPLLCALSSLEAQVPQGFNYQAIARDGSGNPITGATLKVKLSVLSDTTGFHGGTGGTYIWEEEHTNVITNSFGMFTVVLGSPTATKVQGSAASFSEIDWSPANLFVGTKVAQSPAYVYKVLGSAKLWSVPYAIRSKDSEQWTASGINLYRSAGNVGIGTSSPGGRLSIQTSSLWDDNIPIFEVKNKLGVPVLAVYNNGVRILVEDTDGKGVKGGFAIGGFDPTKGPGDETVNLMMVSSDSIRFNIDNNPAKGVKGGFAIGSFDGSKSVNPYGFLNMTPLSSNKGQYNTFIGYESGKKTLSSGNYNTFIGYKSGYNNTTGIMNVFVGHSSGYSNEDGERNVFIGWNSGYSNKSGLQNVFIGESAGRTNSAGAGNVFLGYISGYSNSGGGQNVFIGYGSGYYNSTGNSNVCIGPNSGENNTTGGNNVFIGRSAGSGNTSGLNNIAIGYNAQVPNGATGNQIKLGNEFITYFGVQVSLTVSSDARWKNNINNLDLGLDFVNGLKPVQYTRNNNPSGRLEFGFIAQDIEQMLSDNDKEKYGFLNKGTDGYLELRYNDFIPVLTKAIQQQQETIRSILNENAELKSELAELKQRLGALEAAAGR